MLFRDFKVVIPLYLLNGWLYVFGLIQTFMNRYIYNLQAPIGINEVLLYMLGYVICICYFAGPPTPRQPLNITAVSGGNIFLRCPVSGYPVSSTTWQRDGVNLPANYRHTVFSNGTLYIRNVDGNTDKGVFHCSVRNQQNQAASGKVFVEVMSKLVVPFFTLIV